MFDILGQVAALKRPALLVQAARFGVDHYTRSRHLRRILRSLTIPRPGEAIMRLIEAESIENDKRLTAAADYSIAAHVELLVALMGEARLLRAAIRPAKEVT
jgi:hypothetical protein